MSEEKKEWTCNKCNQEVPLVGVNQYSDGSRTIIQLNLGDYKYEKENLKKLCLCLPCWEQEKEKYLPKIKEKEYSVYKKSFQQI